MPQKNAIEKVFKALHNEALSYFGNADNIEELERLFRKAPSGADKHYQFLSDFNENIATFQLAQALLHKKLAKPDANEVYQVFLTFLRTRYKADEQTIALLNDYFTMLS